MSDPNLDFGLLEHVVRAQRDGETLVERLRHGGLTNEDGNALRSIVHQELITNGFEGDDFEPTDYGINLEALIDAIARRTEGM